VRIPPLVVLGRIAARTGADPWPVLDEAKELATRTGELQRLSAVAIARAEARWLAGEPEHIDAETADVLARGLACDHDVWVVGELAVWRRRAGLRDDDLPPAHATTPFHLELAGRHDEAARLWATIGCRYEAALTRAHAPDDDEQRGALEELLALGATPAAQRVARTLRVRGVRGLRHGPRAKTRANPAGMTARELEVLAHVAEGLRNADIAARLFLSEKTVAHHVSAILRKLDVPSRGQAGVAAARLGLVER
jgi:DNA-binding CsgD family transcriptional regulator